jgi:hypothetical protein
MREGIVGDLDEVHRQRHSRGGSIPAWFWYWGQALAIAVRFSPERASGFGRGFASSVGLDLKLGLRMLVKYPMLTVIGGVAITVAAAIGVGASEFARDLLTPELPLDEGDRVVQLFQVDQESSSALPPSLFDFAAWRESLESIEDLGAYQTQEQGLVSERGEAGTLQLARVTSSTFQATRVPAARGRFITEEDERAGAPPVVVLGHQAWTTLLGSDPGVVGRTVQLGGSPTTVIGVMPEGFGFPMNQNAWIPLGLAGADLEPATSPRVRVFGRLAPGVSLESARAELEARGLAAAAAYPATHGQLRPQVGRFHRFMAANDELPWMALSGAQLLLALLLVVACANVATLVFARTVTREGEIAVRTSLGATRRRIVVQLFTEAFVLVSGSVLLALAIVRTTLGGLSDLFMTVQQEPTPFWLPTSSPPPRSCTRACSW